MAGDSAAFIEVQELDVFYGKSHALRSVSFSIGAGESVGLLGRNGMGKSTLIRSLLGLLPGSVGSVSIDGHLVSGWSTERVAALGIGYVPEGRGIFGNLSVRENLLVAARPARTRGAQGWTYDSVLELFPRLKERLRNGGLQLSGGEQQMLSIARALMTNPRMLIIDELTEGLAPLVVLELWRTIERVREAGTACLLVDRNFTAVLGHTDRALVLEKGQLVWKGRSGDLLEDKLTIHRHLGL